MPHLIITFVLSSLVLLGLPVIGVTLTGHNINEYLVFPHLTSRTQHALFSWRAWALMTCIILMIVILFAYAFGLFSNKKNHIDSQKRVKFPWWGKTALLFTVFFWVIAWNRFTWFEEFQIYTFTPLWLGYIFVLSAITYSTKGRCLLINQPLILIWLSLLSGLFWWYFEYLNLYIKNWYYVGTDTLTQLEIIIHSSFAYATVLPAVICTTEWLGSYPRLKFNLKHLWKIQIIKPQITALVSLFCGSIVLCLATSFTEHLFPLVWIAPLFIISSIQYLTEKSVIFSSIATGDWQPVFLPAVAALICGFFWELWNFKSFAHWEYSIPLVQRFHLFEMPIIGYAGYLLFGVTCMAIFGLVSGSSHIFDHD